MTPKNAARALEANTGREEVKPLESITTHRHRQQPQDLDDEARARWLNHVLNTLLPGLERDEAEHRHQVRRLRRVQARRPDLGCRR